MLDIKRYKLTSMQEVMLLESIDSSSRYINVLRYERPEADAQTLKKRIELLALRHEALRTYFVRDEDGTIWQEVSDSRTVEFIPQQAYTGGANDIQPFAGPLIKFILCENELVVIFHHALFDGWSINILMHELLAEDAPRDKASPFRYYVKWLGKRTYSDDLNWWKRYLDGNSASELPNMLSDGGYHRRSLCFGLDDSSLLRQQASKLRISAGRLLQAVWCMLTARYNGGDSVVCCVNSGRSAPVPGIVGMVGMCVNTLPIATKLPKPPESITFADWVSDWNRQTSEAEKHGFCRLSDIMKGSIPHILSIEPPFNDGSVRLKATDAKLVTDFDAIFTLNGEIGVEFAYNSHAYSDEAVMAVKGHFLTALNAVLENTDIPVEQIPILTNAEKAVFVENTDDDELLDIIEKKTVLDLWSETAAVHGNRTALVFGDISFTYSELHKAVILLACALAAKGVAAETPVAVLLDRSEKYVIAELAIMTAGGFFVPLDTQWPDDRIKSILAGVNPLLVIDEALYRELTGVAVNSVFALPKPSDAAYMIMTSGTTGVPKGVVVTHRSLANYCLWEKANSGWEEGDSCAMVFGFAFDASLWDIMTPLISGGCLHILNDDMRLSMKSVGEYCRTNRITLLNLPLSAADVFCEIYRGSLPHLRAIVTGGEEMRNAPNAPYRVANEYGPTECTVCCTSKWVKPAESPISIGVPVANMRVYVLDAWGRHCPDGVVGEAFFSGVQVARGYYNSPELTNERFLSNPFSGGDLNHDILYRTGDLLKWERHGKNRELYFQGRMDSQVKINGYRIELGEIESVLRSHPGVLTVFADIRKTASGDKRICAYVVPIDRMLDITELDGMLASKLPSHMRAAIIAVDEIPQNTSGKVDLSLLPVPEIQCTAEYSKPLSEKEKLLVSAVLRTLNLTGIGINHNYIELGGNSINAMRISFYVEQEGYALSAKELITSVNLAHAAKKMQPVRHAAGLEQVSPTTFTPLAAQQAMIFLAETAGHTMYTVTVRLGAPQLDIDVLKNRLDKATRLHDILRTVFERDENGKISGRICDAHRIPIYTDHYNGPEGINPLSDPLINLTLSGGTLTIRYHHIILDGHSVSMLTRELLYGDFPKSAPSFAEFATRLNANAERRDADETWWRRQCGNAGIVRLLPPKTDKAAEYGRITACSPELLKRCVEAAKTVHVTPAAFMLTAWGVVVDASDAVDGSGILVPFVASCRNDDALMGMCGETRPLVFKPRGNTFAELAKNVQAAMLESVSHWFAPQDIIGRLPDYLFVFEDGAADATADGEQNYDLVIKFSDRVELIYNAARIGEGNLKRIASCLEASLKSAVQNRISVLSMDEYELVTSTFARGRFLDVKHQTAAEAFASAAEMYGDRIAVETDNEAFTYSELYMSAKNLADEMTAKGLGAGDIAAFCLPRNAEGIIAQLAVSLSGAAFLPIDPAWPEARITDILKDSGAAAVIKDGLNICITGAIGKVPPDTAYIIYTSGTTGKPKGVLIPQIALANQIAWTIDQFGLEPADKILHYIAYTFDPSVWVIFTTLASGASLSLLSEATRLNPEAAALHIAERNITRCTLPSAVAADILLRMKKSVLRTVFLGGEAIKNLPNKMRDYEIINLYGPTEACINSTFYHLPHGETETRIIGWPVAGTSCYVLDAHGEPCPIGIPGELCIGGIQLASSYLNRPSESSLAFTEHPHFGRLYKTGDRAAWNDDGTLTFHGRTDGQVKIRGNRVELAEIECALCELEGVSDAKVVYRDGAADAYIIGASDTAVLKNRLPSYMIPRSVTVMESFPLTENGKIDVKALPAPSIIITESDKPLTELEQSIASAWKTALGLPQDFTIRSSDSFDELGGHSLLLFHVMGLLSASGLNANIKTLIEHSVLRDLADALGHRETKSIQSQRENTAACRDSYESYVRQMERMDLTKRRDFCHILITGGTGFLGSHLVCEFYEHADTAIHLPIRGEASKLQDVLEHYFGRLGTEMFRSGRLYVYNCDISETLPNIDAPLDALFHTAADIRHYAPEQEMYRANVTATENMLAFLNMHPHALFSHISTTSAVNAPIIYETDTDLGPEFENIYQRTKQLAEQRVLEAGKHGLNYAVFRVGHISPGFKSGSMARNYEINAMMRLMNAMLLTGLLPEQDYKIGYGYVDKTARAIRLLSTPVNLNRQVFHIDNPNTLRLSEIFKTSGLDGTVLPKEELTARLTSLSETGDAAVRQAAAEYLGRLFQGDLERDSRDVTAGILHMDATLILLERLGFKWPHLTAEYINDVMRNLKNKGGMPK